MRRFVLFLAGLAGAGYAGYRFVVEPWWRSWGIDPSETDRTLPGDELVPGPSEIETRGITIDAPPANVWPWLVQMGFGRAGWYSYDRMDMAGRSADRIVTEWQDLAVGDTVPTHPGGGLVVKSIEPQRSLVLYLDNEIVKSWTARASDHAEGNGKTPANLAAAGAFMTAAQPPEFAASWAFVLEPLGAERTRLIERFRIHFGDAKPWNRYTLPMMGFGVFVMMRKHMLGLRERAQRSGETLRQEVPATA
jgi:hypothetical protein